MASRFLAIGTLGAVAAVAVAVAAGAVSTLRHTHLRPSVTPGTSRLQVFGRRSAQQVASITDAKFDGALADLTRHIALVRPDHAVQDLRSLAPAARFKQGQADASPLVLIDAVTVGDPQQLKTALVALGLQHPAVYSNDVGGWLPVSQLEAATARAEVHSIRAAMPRTRTGEVTTQGDFVQHSDTLRSANSLSGAGVTVGVLSDSFDCYAVYAANKVPAGGAAGYASNGKTATAATDVTTGDLPSTVNVLEEAEAGNGGCMNYGKPAQLPFGDEGRAMLQIVHDVAPGASLAFYTAENSEADFANGIGKLADSVAAGGAGATVIADDVGYYDEPFFQDGILAQAIDAVEAKGVAYFSAAGNDGSLAYDNTAPSFATVSTAAPNSGEHLLNFDASGATQTSLPVTIASLMPGEFVAIVVEWDQPYVTGAPDSGGSTSQIDVCITGAAGTDEIENIDGTAANCTGALATGSDPYQVLIVGNPANAAANTAAEPLNIQVGLAGGPVPGRIKVVVEDDGAGSVFTGFATGYAGGTLQGHPGAAGAAAVGAAFYFNTPACGTTPAMAESFSSRGGDPILFDTTGARLPTPVTRQKPDFVGPDGGNDTFLGFFLLAAGGGLTGPGGLLNTSIAACQNNTSYPNFFGTSAATPHVASIAALMRQANPTATPTQIYQALRGGALAMSTPSPSIDTGYGFVQADAAFALLPPPAPTLTLAASSIVVGGSTTITWSSTDATGCTASGGWSGKLAANGTETLTPTAAGTDTYSLTCSDTAGTSPAATATLTVTAAPAKSGGGGALGPWTLLFLAVLGLWQFFRLRPRVLTSTP